MTTIKLGGFGGYSLDTFSLHDRELHLTHHPDGGEGQVVLVAVFGNGTSPFGGKHELCLCLDDASRKRLIETLQSKPEEDACPHYPASCPGCIWADSGPPEAPCPYSRPPKEPG